MSRLNDILNAIVGKLPKDDTVTAHGSGNYWIWRKWESGQLEAWYTGSLTTDIGTQSGSIYTSTAKSISIQSGTAFTTVNAVFIEIINGSYPVWSAMGSYTTSDISTRLLSNQSRSSATYSCRAYVVGRWKA